MTNYIRRMLFAPSMNFVQFIALIVLANSFRFWIALPAYLLFCWFVEPLLARLVGATPAELLAQAQAAAKDKANNN